MKAVILAGGEGTRLRPLTVNVPKPMTRLADRPVMEYIIRLLARQGIREIAVTTAYLPQMIESYFGDGADFGVELTYFRETTPKGTAGSVRQCADFLRGDDFLVISGDCICDFDFTPCISLHRKVHAEATLALYRHQEPLEYGLVVTAPDGRVERFVEKPGWEQVCTDAVNTGVYILSPAALEMIPRDCPFDFAQDLFPKLLERKSLYAQVLDGYWCDIGDCGAFLHCACDILDGKLRPVAPELSVPDKRKRSFPNAYVYEPSYIASDVRILPGAVVGPYAVLESGTVIGECAAVSESVCSGSIIGDGAEIDGAIIGRGAVIGVRSRIESGSVIGDDAKIGDYAVISGGARIWTGQNIPDGVRISETVTAETDVRRTVIGEDGRIEGNLRLEDGTALGMALAQSAGTGGTVALGCTSGAAEDAFLMAVEAGIRTCGGTVIRHDAPFEACARFAQRLCRAEFGVYITDCPDGISAAIAADDAEPPDRKVTRKIEGAALRRDVARVQPDQQNRTFALTGCRELYLANVGAALDCEGVNMSVIGSYPAAEVLSELLKRHGVILTRGAYIEWRPSKDGLTLEAVDEDGNLRDDAALRACLRMLFPDSDREFSFDAAQCALELTAELKKRNTKLSELAQTLPESVKTSCDVELRHERAEVMRRLTEMMKGDAVLNRKDGTVRVRPCADRKALRITAEAAAAETAEELCNFMLRRAQEADSK